MGAGVGYCSGTGLGAALELCRAPRLPSPSTKHMGVCLVAQVTIIRTVATRGRSYQAAVLLVLSGPDRQGLKVSLSKGNKTEDPEGQNPTDCVFQVTHFATSWPCAISEPRP